MAINRYQVPEKPAADPGTGPYFSSDTHNDGVQTVHKDKIVICNSAGTIIGVDNTNPLVVGDGGGSISVDDNAGSLTVDSAQLPASPGQATMANSLPVALASNQSTVGVSQPEQSTTGTITAVNQNVALTLSGGASTALISIWGTWTGTLVFQTSSDNTVFWNTNGVNIADGSVVVTATTNRNVMVPVTGDQAVRVTASAWTSGTANIIIRAGQGSSVVSLASPIPTGTNTIGSIGNSLAAPAGVRLSDGAAALVGQKAMTASLPVTLASDQSALSVASHAVTDGGSSLTVDSPQLPAALGQGTMAQSLPVTMASNQGALQIQGTSVAQVAGTIVNATSVVGGATDYSAVNNVTVTISGTYAGVNAAFEVSDNAGTTWFPIAGQRDDNAVAESTTGPLPTDRARSWVFSLLGYDRLRVRATAWTSGTANVRISTASMPFEPVVSSVTNKPPSAISTNFLFSGAAVTAEALASLTPYRAGVAGSAGTSQAITAGKSFRLQAMTVGYRVGAAAVGGGIAYLRWLAGTVLVGSPILASVGASANAAVSGSGGGTTLTFGDGFDIPPGFSLGVTHIGHATTATITVSVLGYEY